MIIYFLISLIGHALIQRNITSMARDFGFSQQLIRVISVANLAVICILTALFSFKPTMLWLFIGILLITLKFFPPILRFFLIRRLRNALIPVLDCVIMGLQAGQSFRSSLREAFEMQTGWVRVQLLEVFDSFHMSKNVIDGKSALLKDFRDDLLQIELSRTRCVEQVRALRRHLKMQQDFRRRSGQVTQQIKMQAIIVTALYCGLLAFVILQFGFEAHRFLIFISALVFVTGLLWIFLMGRRMKWKV